MNCPPPHITPAAHVFKVGCPGLFQAKQADQPKQLQPAQTNHLVGPGVDVLVTMQPPYNCNSFFNLPVDRIVIDPCAQPVTGVPLLVGHNMTNLLWGASVGWVDGTVVNYGGRQWTITHTQVVDHYITYYPMPTPGTGLQIRTCQPDGLHEWVWDLR